MIPQREDGLSLFTAKNRNDTESETEHGSKHKRCRCSLSSAHAEDSRRTDVPLEIILDHIAPFLDRRTYNACLLLCRKARHILTASWWKTTPAPCKIPGGTFQLPQHQHQLYQQQQQQLPPWPRKLVAKDPSCRVRCLTFSGDNAMLACGCSDGKVRCWDVRLGELSMPAEGHWPDEAVIALAYSNRTHPRLLASSSTDGTIRIWRIQQLPRTASVEPRPTTMSTTTKCPPQQLSMGEVHHDGTTGSTPWFVRSSCLLCIPSDHAVSLHFSPDDSYLVSGHLRMRFHADHSLPNSAIEIREVATGARLRRLEGGGVPLGFVPSPIGNRHSPLFHESSSSSSSSSFSSWEDREEVVTEEHRLISTCGPNTCLKLWSWNRTRCVTNEPDNDHEIESEHQHQHQTPNSLEEFLRNHPHGPMDESIQQRLGLPLPSFANVNSSSPRVLPTEQQQQQQPKTLLDGGRCIQQWFLDRFNTVLPVPASTATRSNPFQNGESEAMETTTKVHGGNNIKSTEMGAAVAACEILVAVINEPSKDSFAVWNTSSPKDRKIFRNTSPYEIRFSPDGSKIASVDNFNTVKVWRISDGVLLKTFSGNSEDETDLHHQHCRHCRIPIHSKSHNRPYHGEEEEDSDETSVSHSGEDSSGSEDRGGLFPIHELVFSKDSSTVAVISRCYNEVHLFST